MGGKPVDALFWLLTEKVTMVITLAYLLSRVKIFRRLLYKKATVKEKVVLVGIFAMISIFGNYPGITVEGAIVNSRVVGASVAGLLGGPWVGLGAGVIAGLHRYFLGGFTAVACGLSTALEGLVAGLIGYHFRGKLSLKLIFFTGVFIEFLQMVIVLLIARPLDKAWLLVSIVGMPMIVVNSVAITIFMVIVRNTFLEEERLGATKAQKALLIANRTLPILRQGLNKETALQTVKIIFEMADVAAVAITDEKSVLAHVGVGEDHHQAGGPIQTRATKVALQQGLTQIAQAAEEIGCDRPGCQLNTAVIVPLKVKDKVAGVLKLYQIRGRKISSLDVELAGGIAALISTQIELADLNRQAELLTRAELRLLQSQINPHFLFNALNTVKSICRQRPEQARFLLGQLGEFFRKNLQTNREFVTLKEELEHIRAYLDIEQARFGDKLKVEFDVDEEALNCCLPQLLLQPLVENAIKHGIYPKVKGGTVKISIRAQERELAITVKDDGVGMCPGWEERLQAGTLATSGLGIGLKNVNERLKTIYGKDRGLGITSKPGEGTKISVTIAKALNGGDQVDFRGN